MNKKIFLTIVLSSTALFGFAQNMVAAYRLSNVSLQGTARATAMGNAFGAVGGDFTSSSINPAGLGLYVKDEFVATMQLGNYQNKASYLNMNTETAQDNFSLPNMGYVGIMKTDPSLNSSLVTVNFGIGYNRMNNFNTSNIIRGTGATSSMLDILTDNVNIGYVDDFYEGVAIKAGAIYQPNSDEEGNPVGTFHHDMQKYHYDDGLPEENFAHDQKKTIYQEGSQDEYTFSLGLNFNHKLYLGATLGVQDVDFYESSTMYENNVDYEDAELDSYLVEYGFNQTIETRGTGVNAKFGMIYKPIESLRVGVALHTPTYYSLSDYYDTYMYNGYDVYDEETNGYVRIPGESFPDNPGAYDYKINSPLKAIFSAAYVMGKRAIFSVDYEYMDYSNMKLRKGGSGWDTYDFMVENDDIKSTYKSVGNLHLGAEVRLTNEVSVRGGYEYLPSTYKEEGWQANTETFSAGIGYSTGRFFMDFAYKHLNASNKITLYDMPLGIEGLASDYDNVVTSSVANIDHKRNLYTLTLGFRF